MAAPTCMLQCSLQSMHNDPIVHAGSETGHHALVIYCNTAVAPSILLMHSAIAEMIIEFWKSIMRMITKIDTVINFSIIGLRP